MKNFIFLITVCCLLASCESKEKKLHGILSELQGKEIVLPMDADIEVYSNIAGLDSLCGPMMVAKTKILVYVDSVGCSSCKLNIEDWMMRIEEAKALAADPDDVSILIYFWVQNKERFYLRRTMAQHKFNYPVFFDKNNNIGRLNNLPEDDRFHAFLLDNDNKVVVIGSPQGNDKMWELYKTQIVELTR